MFPGQSLYRTRSLLKHHYYIFASNRIHCGAEGVKAAVCNSGRTASFSLRDSVFAFPYPGTLPHGRGKAEAVSPDIPCYHESAGERDFRGSRTSAYSP